MVCLRRYPSQYIRKRIRTHHFLIYPTRQGMLLRNSPQLQVDLNKSALVTIYIYGCSSGKVEKVSIFVFVSLRNSAHSPLGKSWPRLRESRRGHDPRISAAPMLAARFVCQNARNVNFLLDTYMYFSNAHSYNAKKYRLMQSRC